MKCAMTVLAALLAFAAVAQEPEGAAKARPRVATRPAVMAQPSMEPVVRMAQNKKMAEKLGITEEQIAKLKELADNRAAVKELNEKVRKGTERQAELLNAEKIDEKAVMALVEEVWDAKKEIAKLQTKRVIDVKSVLTPEQVRKVREALKAMRPPHSRGKRPEGEKKAK